MYLKYSFMIMTISIGFLFWFIWGELQRLKVQLAIQKSEMELFRKEIINLINKAEDAIKKEVLDMIRDDNAHNEKRLQTMAEEITGKIEQVEQSIEQTDRILTLTRDELTNIADGVDKSVEEDTLSIINQLNNLLGYSVKDGEK